MMKMGFGRYKEKTVAWVLLKDINYLLYIFRNDPNKPACIEFLRLLRILDNKPFVVGCEGRCNPKNLVSFFTIYEGAASMSLS